MENRQLLKIKIFQDGANLNDMISAYEEGLVKGFTTNPTLMRKAGITDYEAFAKEAIVRFPALPISLEVFADDFSLMADQARVIASWGRNIFVKIPITNTRGELSTPLIKKLLQEDIKLNITAILTPDQVQELLGVLRTDLPTIVSVFAGRIADTGKDPVPMMKQCAAMLKSKKSVELLWASPREVLNLYQAEECGCHIITMSSNLIKKLSLRGKDLRELSRETVQMFYDDARKSKFEIKSDKK